MTRKHPDPTHPASGAPRRSRRIHEDAPDETRRKPAELTACPRCGACFREGRWTWHSAPVGSPEQVCPACERTEADYPAGVVHVGGGFASAHRSELEALLRHVEERERAEHPLKRIMSVEDEGTGFLVKTTDARLAEAMGRALASAYQGELLHPPTTAEPGQLVRVRWTRD